MGPIQGNVTGSLYVFHVAWVPTCLTGIDISRNLEAEILKKNIKNDPAIKIFQYRVFQIESPPMGPIRGNVTESLCVVFVA